MSTNRLVKSLFVSLLVMVYLLVQWTPVAALTEEQKNAIDSGAFYFDVAGDVTCLAGTGTAYQSLDYPAVLNDDDRLADAIDTYIEAYKGATPTFFDGLGSSFITGARRSNVNPMLAVAHLEHESAFGTAERAGWHNTTPPSHNGFGRSATADQPHTVYAGRNGARLVYRWSSWANSLDDGEAGDDWFRYVRRVYLDGRQLDPNDLPAYIHVYAPQSDGNDEAAYVSYIRRVINDIMAIYNGAEPSDSSSKSSAAVDGCSGGEIAQRVVQLALDEVGNAEDPSGSNCGPNINKYFETLGYRCGQPWCAAFVRYIYFQAGAPEVGGGLSAKAVGTWFDNNKEFWDWDEPIRPRPGDIFVKGRNGSGDDLDNGSGHIGIVVSIDGFTMVTVEGNSANKVSQRTYHDYRAISELVGFGRYVNPGEAPPDPSFDPRSGEIGENSGGASEE